MPTVSIIDPDTIYPAAVATFSQLFSFRNAKILKPYEVHSRSMSDYTNLGVQKQDTLILATNGNDTSRAVYSNPATLCFATYAPTFAGSANILMGEFVYKIEYEFSGMKAPGLAVQQPRPCPMPLPVSPPVKLVMPQDT
jgi:hypothetical protein